MIKSKELFLFPAAISFGDKLGVIGVLLMAFFGWVGVTGAYIGLVLVALATAVNFRNLDFFLLGRLTSIRLFLLLVFYILLWEIAIRFVMSVGSINSVSEQWVLVLLPWLSVWFYRFPQLIPRVLLLAAIGLLGETVVLVIERWDQFIRVWDGGHVFYARAWGLYLGSVALGLVVFFPRILSIKTSNIALTWFLKLLYLVVIVWVLQCFLAAQTRMAWICFSIVLLLVLTVSVIDAFGKSQNSRRKVIGLSLILLVAISSLIAINLDSISSRFEVDKSNVEKIMRGDDDLSYTSASIRYAAFKYGIEKWDESPLLGLGPQSTKEMIAESDIYILRDMPHFHSGYLEVLVQLGIVGLVLFVGAITYMLVGLAKAYFSGLVAGDYALFIGGIFLMITLWSILNFRMLRADWLFYWIILTGICQSYGMRYKAHNVRVWERGS